MMKIGALEQKTYRELRRLAARAGLTGLGRMRKAHLVRALLKGRKARPAPPRAAAAEGRGQRKPAQRTARAHGRNPHAGARRAAARSRHKRAAAASPAANTPVPQKRKRDLPDAYHRTRLTLMEVDPHHVYAYWEVTPEDRAAATARLGSGNAVGWVLRFCETTGDGSAPRECAYRFDIPVDLAPGNWYVTLPAAGKSYRADLGPISASGRFQAACSSNVVFAPRGHTASRYEPRWLRVSGTAARHESGPGAEGRRSRGRPQAGRAGKHPAGTTPTEGPAGFQAAGVGDEAAFPETEWTGTEAEWPPALTPEIADISSFELGTREQQSEEAEDGD